MAIHSAELSRTKGGKPTGITAQLPEDLGELVAEEAARQAISPDELVVRVLADYIETHPHLTTVGEPSPSGEGRTSPRRTVVRLLIDIPAALWLGLFFLLYAAIFVLVIVVIVRG